MEGDGDIGLAGFSREHSDLSPITSPYSFSPPSFASSSSIATGYPQANGRGRSRVDAPTRAGLGGADSDRSGSAGRTDQLGRLRGEGLGSTSSLGSSHGSQYYSADEHRAGPKLSSSSSSSHGSVLDASRSSYATPERPLASALLKGKDRELSFGAHSSSSITPRQSYRSASPASAAMTRGLSEDLASADTLQSGELGRSRFDQALPPMGISGVAEDRSSLATAMSSVSLTTASPDATPVTPKSSSFPPVEMTPRLADKPLDAGLMAAFEPQTVTMPAAPLDDELNEDAVDRALLQRWVLSVGCVNFDLDKGPDLEFLYPPLGISREERDNIAFSSFPDTSIFDDGHCVFSWRVREVPLASSNSEPPQIPTPSPTWGSSSGHGFLGRRRGPLSSPFGGDSAAKQGGTAALASNGGQRRGSAPDLGTNGKSAAKGSASSSGHRLLSGAGGLFGTRGASRIGKETSLSSDEDEGSDEARSAGYLPVGTGSPDQADASPRDGRESASASPSPRPDTGKLAPGMSMAGSRSGDDLSAPLAHVRRANHSTSYIYGYVFFRQKRDASIRRGYFQKSVVILSHLPYVSLFTDVVSKLGPMFFQHGMPMLEAFCNDVSHWPSPEPGTVLHLPFLGNVLSTAIPYGQQVQSSDKADAATMTRSASMRGSRSQGARRAESGSEGRPLLASVPTSLVVDTFRELLDDMWLLWECLLLAEPILVVGPDPQVVSEAVWHMLDLIRPVPFGGDWRPFITIHDHDFKALVTRNKPAAGTVLGATNPFMLSACSHWPHVLRVGKAAVKVPPIARHAHSASVGGKRPLAGAGTPVGGGVAGGHGAGGGGPEHVPGLTSKRKRRVSKDRPLIKRLHEMLDAKTRDDTADEEMANLLLRRYFSDLTERFLAPLNRYVSSLIPAEFDLSSPALAPKIKPFNTDAFMASLKAHGTPLPLRSRSLPTGAAVRQGFYLDFLKCPNFSLWLQDRIAAAEEEQWRRRVAVLEQGDVLQFAKHKGELEAIDLYSRLLEEIRLVDAKLAVPPELGPGSRWRTDTPINGSQPRSASSQGESESVAGSCSSGRSTPVSPYHGSSSPSLYASVPMSLSASAPGQKALLARRIRLANQLGKLAQTLPEDLRISMQS